MLLIRSFNQNDFSSVLPLFRSHRSFVKANDQQLTHYIAKNLQRPDTGCWVACDEDDKVVGWLMFRFNAKRISVVTLGSKVGAVTLSLIEALASTLKAPRRFMDILMNNLKRNRAGFEWCLSRGALIRPFKPGVSIVTFSIPRSQQ